jgi:hypothetical protein
VREVLKQYDLSKGFVVVVRVGFLDLGFDEVNRLVKDSLVAFKKSQVAL